MHLTFNGGSETTHDCVIGRDGVRFEMRKFVLGKDDPVVSPVFFGKYCHRGWTPMGKVIGMLRGMIAVNSQMFLWHRAHMLTFPVEHGKAFNGKSTMANLTQLC